MFLMKKCTYCKRKMKDNWSYCPTCGTQANKQVTMFNLLKRQMDIAENFSLEDFTKHMQAKDPMLYNSTLAASAPRMPGFIKEMHAKAAAVKDLVTVSADSVDGLLYLGHFGAQVGRSSRIEDCRDYLHDAEYLEMHKLENQ